MNVYNVKDRSLHSGMRTSSIFSERRIYPSDLVKAKGYNLESPFAKLFHEKLMSGKCGEKIILSRKEIMLMKRFFYWRQSVSLQCLKLHNEKKLFQEYILLCFLFSKKKTFQRNRIRQLAQEYQSCGRVRGSVTYFRTSIMYFRTAEMGLYIPFRLFYYLGLHRIRC